MRVIGNRLTRLLDHVGVGDTLNGKRQRFVGPVGRQTTENQLFLVRPGRHRVGLLELFELLIAVHLDAVFVFGKRNNTDVRAQKRLLLRGGKLAAFEVLHHQVGELSVGAVRKSAEGRVPFVPIGRLHRLFNQRLGRVTAGSADDRVKSAGRIVVPQQGNQRGGVLVENAGNEVFGGVTVGAAGDQQRHLHHRLDVSGGQNRGDLSEEAETILTIFRAGPLKDRLANIDRTGDQDRDQIAIGSAVGCGVKPLHKRLVKTGGDDKTGQADRQVMIGFVGQSVDKIIDILGRGHLLQSEETGSLQDGVVTGKRLDGVGSILFRVTVFQRGESLDL